MAKYEPGPVKQKCQMNAMTNGYPEIGNSLKRIIPSTKFSPIKPCNDSNEETQLYFVVQSITKEIKESISQHL